MKKFYHFKFSLVLLLVSLSFFISAQNTITNLSPKWRLGLNAGATWQTSDVKSNAGLAGGFNIERVLNRHDDAPIGFSLGFRYLSGWTYGMDTRKNSDLKNNNALNGKNDSTLNYFANPGYFYNNYKSKVADGALELKINFPAFEKRTHIVFHVFGGLGITKFKTRIDALDKDFKMYDYTKFTGAPGLSDLKSIYGGSYETYAQGSNSSGSYVFNPSLGVGLGYRFNKNLAIVFEHKVLFTFTDDLDGVRSSGNIPINGANDIYHYSSAGLLFTIHGKGSTSSTYTTTPTNTVVTNGQTDPNNYTTYEPKPAITIYNPSSNPYQTSSGNLQVSGNIQHITSAAGISVSQNGISITNFNFNSNNGAISFGTVLAPGANNFYITATNNAGSDNESFTVNYSTQNPIDPINNNTPVLYPPVVVISSPSNNYITSNPNLTVTASASNISSAGNVAISVNGYNVSNFNFNPSNGSINFPVTLNEGNNSVIVSAFNTAGSDAKTINLVYKKDAQVNTNLNINPAPNKPVVTFYNPSSCPYTAYTNSFSVTALVTNVSSASQVSVNVNGNAVNNFSLNANGYVSFPMNLNQGANSVIVTGTNEAGSDVKTCVINYVINGFPPEVMITSPAASPHNTTAATYTVEATVKNVNSQNDVRVMVNSIAQNNFTYNAATQKVSVPLNLNMGLTSVMISATTSFGSDTKTTNISRNAVDAKPQVTIISPSPSPYNTTNLNVPVTAQVLNVSGQNQISVTNGNQPVPFNYDVNTHLVTFTPALVTGSNTFTVKGFTKAASDSKSLVINYTEPVANTPLPEKPVVSFYNPSACPYTAYTANFNVTAMVTNVSNANQVSVNANGTNISNFTLAAGGYVNFSMNLNQGSNSVIITGTNTAGSDVKTCVINYVINGFPPVVNITSPTANPYTTTNATFAVDATVQNVNSQNEITVTVNGSSSNFTYNAATQKVTVPLNLNLGATSVTITATTTFGSSTKTATIDRVNPDPKPQVTIISPSPSPYTTTSAQVPVTAQVLNVTGSNQVSVTSGGQIIPFNYDANTHLVTFTPALALGYNTFIVKGFNKSSSDSKSLTIEYKNGVQDSIRINNGPGSGHGGGNNNNGGHGGNSGGNGTPSDSTKNSGGGNNGGHGNGSGDVDNSRTVTICHNPPGNTGNPQTLVIPQSALAAHLAHGDQVGACPPAINNNNNNNNNNLGNPGKNNGENPGKGNGNNNSNNNNGNMNNSAPKNGGFVSEPKTNTSTPSSPKTNTNTPATPPKTITNTNSDPIPPRGEQPKAEEPQNNNGNTPRAIKPR